MEAFLKICSMGRQPMRYFKNTANMFDFFVTVISVVLLMANTNPLVFSLCRLFRCLELVSHSTKLRWICGGFVGGIKSIMYIIALMSVVLFVYAVTGVFYFSKNDPYNFGTLRHATISLLKLTTLDDWRRIFYANFFGCEWATNAAPMFVYSDKSMCTASEARAVIAVLYFVSYIVITPWIIIALFVGSVLQSMDAVLKRIEAETEKKNRELGSRQRNRLFGAPSPKKASHRRATLRQAEMAPRRSESTKKLLVSKPKLVMRKDYTVFSLANMPRKDRRHLYKAGKLEKAFAAFVAAEAKRTRTRGATAKQQKDRARMPAAQPHAGQKLESLAGKAGQVLGRGQRAVGLGLPHVASMGRLRAISSWRKQGRAAPVVAGQGVHPFFDHTDGLTVVARNLLYKESCDADYQKDTVICNQDEPGYEMYFIVFGKVSVQVDGKKVTELHEGDIFGERSLLYQERRTASIVTTMPTTCIVVTSTQFQLVLRVYPQLADALDKFCRPEHYNYSSWTYIRAYINTLDIVTQLNAQNPHVNVLRSASSNCCESLMHKYAELALSCDFVLGDDHRSRFELIASVLVIFGSGIGAVKLSISQEETSTTVSSCNDVVLIVLAVEVCVKLVAEGFQPHHFFRSKTNVVNLLLLGGSIYVGVRPNPEVLLVLFFHHLLYFVKLAKAVRSRRLDGVIAGLRAGLKSVHHIGFLLLIVFYIYAVIGTLLLGQNDPFHFGTLHWSLITLFAMSCADWAGVMEVSIYGCDNTVGYPYRFPGMEKTGLESVPTQMHNEEIIPLPNTTSRNTTAHNTTSLIDGMVYTGTPLCDHPHAHGFSIAVFFVSFVFISVYITLNLFLGVVTSAMTAEELRCDYTDLQQQCIAKMQRELHISNFHLQVPQPDPRHPPPPLARSHTHTHYIHTPPSALRCSSRLSAFLQEYRDAFAVISSNGRVPVGLEELRIVFNALGEAIREALLHAAHLDRLLLPPTSPTERARYPGAGGSRV
jgi:voltage-gated sodium channel